MHTRWWLDPVELVLTEDGVAATVWRDSGRGPTLDPESLSDRVAAAARLRWDEAREFTEHVFDRLGGQHEPLTHLTVVRIERAIGTFRGSGVGRTRQIAEAFLRVLTGLADNDRPISRPISRRPAGR